MGTAAVERHCGQRCPHLVMIGRGLSEARLWPAEGDECFGLSLRKLWTELRTNGAVREKTFFKALGLPALDLNTF